MQNEVIPKKYIEVDSTYRDRTQYPNPGQFKVPILYQRNNKPEESIDGISFGSGEYFWKGSLDLDFDMGGVPSAVKIATGFGTEQIYRGQFVRDDVTQEEALVTFFSAYNLICYLETPFNDFTVGNGATVVNPSTKSKILMFRNAIVFDDQFVGGYLTNLSLNESRKIIGFSSKFMTIDVEVPFSNPSQTDTYVITRMPSLQLPTTILPVPPSIYWGKDSNGQFIVIPSGSEIEDAYTNKYINLYYFISGNNSLPLYKGSLITKYTGGVDPFDRKAYIYPPISEDLYITGGALFFTISNFTKDVANSLTSFIDENFTPKLYEISMNNLVLPNTVIDNSLGGTTANYPYVYVSLYNSRNNTRSLIDSNNPNATRATFRCPITDVNNFEISTFIKINSEMVNVFRFNPREDLFFEVRLPDGTLFKSTTDDTDNPVPPDPLLQISACFSFIEVDESSTKDRQYFSI